jgi:superfamily II DNA/RNA helicase
MLTATPIQNRLWDLYTLIDLLTVAKGHRNPLGTPDEFRGRYLLDRESRKLNPLLADHFRDILRQYLRRTRREDTGLTFPDRIVEMRRLSAGDVESQMQELVADEIARLNRLSQISVSQAMMSIPQALAAQMANMAGNESIGQEAADAVKQLAEQQPRTAKLEGLLTLIRELKTKHPSDWRLVVFTLRKETQQAIGRALMAEGVAVGFIRGGCGRENQSTVERFRVDPPKVNVVVSTDTGAEGVNLQAGNVLVNYDLPWNPMLVEQRIGRIQRLATKHAKVIVINLVIADSVEEQVVGRLQEKLQAISQTIGDIESILESSSQEEECSFEEMIRRMVVSSLQRQDVEKAMRARISSIERAKTQMEQERASIDEVFGTKVQSGGDEPAPPKFEPVKPALAAEDFVMRALTAEGATLQPQADGTIDVLRRGQAVERLTFKPELAERVGTGVFMGNAPKLYLPGRPPFERLVQRWLQRGGHAVRDFSRNTEALTLLAAKKWCDGLPDAVFVNFKIKETSRRTTGNIVCRAKAVNGVDSLEKLISIEGTGQVMQLLGEKLAAAPIVRESLTPVEVLPDDQRMIAAAVGQDKDVGAFCHFYDGRKIQELGKAGNDQRRQHKVEADLSPKTFAEVVAMTGVRYDRVRTTVEFALDHEYRYEAELKMIPALDWVLDQPGRKQCAITKRQLPASCLRACAISGQLATGHLLAESAVSGRRALPEYAVRCSVTGKQVLQDEVWASDLSGRLASMDLFQSSAIGGRRGLSDEMAICEVTGARVLVDELLLSDVSAKRFRKDEVAKSDISGRVGHRTELAKCAETGAVILPDEAGQSAFSGKTVRRDELLKSEKPPHRLGTLNEMRVCAKSGKALLADEVISSAVSGLLFDRDLAVFSDVSGKAGLAEEMVKCEKTGALVLPTEAGRSDVSAILARNALLEQSPVSGRRGLREEFVTCEITGSRVLMDELVRSDESGRLFRKDQAVTTAETNRIGHESEAIECNGLWRRILRSEAGVSAITGKMYSRSLLHPSEKHPERLGLRVEMATCAVSGKQLLLDETGESCISGRRADRNLLRPSPRSGRLAIPDEFVACDLTGVQLLPDEIETCFVTNKRVDKTLLAPSELSGRKALPVHMIRSPVSGRYCLPTESVPCTWRGVPMPRDEVAMCRLTGLMFSREFINADNEFSPLRDLLDGTSPGTDGGDLAGWLTSTVNGSMRGLVSVRCFFSPGGSARAVCGETRTMMGFRVRHAGLIVAETDRRVLGRVVVGKRGSDKWRPEDSVR